MKARILAFLVGAFVLAATAFSTQEAQAQYCFTDNFGYEWDVNLDVSTNIIYGTVGNWVAGGQMSGGRGQTSSTIRHHVFTAINPDAGLDPGCGDGTGFTDWFTYNGTVTGGGPFGYSGRWYNSCGSSGSFNGTIVAGACPAPRGQQTPVPGSPGFVAEAQVEASARITDQLGVEARPNPFEAETALSFTLPETSDVRIVVYDALGRQVAVLADEERTAGTHTVTFDARDLAPGVYVYRLTSGTQVRTGRMTVAQ